MSGKNVCCFLIKLISIVNEFVFNLRFPASPTRRLCMEYNKKNIAAKLSPSGTNSEYQEETENDLDEEDDVYMEQNFTDVSAFNANVSECEVLLLLFILD